MQKVLTAAQMREVDRRTTEEYGIPSILLMENAAHAVARVITEKLGGSVKGKSILILCGPGNNGGDGTALARILNNEGCLVYVTVFGTVKKAKGDAKVNFQICRELATNNPLLRFEEVTLTEEDTSSWWSDFIYRFSITRLDCVVDSLFGTGFQAPIKAPLDRILETFWTNINRRFHELRLISVDLPSGLDADRSDPRGWHFFPDVTVTFTSPKMANVLPNASQYNGTLIVANIGSPQNLVDEQQSKVFLAQKRDADDWLMQSGFTDESYKNKRGHALLIAGSKDYTGAAALCGNAAMRSGAGLVTVTCPSDAKAEVASRLLPDVILSTIDSPDVSENISKADAIAVGCGLDPGDKAIEKFVREVVDERKVPVVVDASALWFYSPFPKENAQFSGGPPLILTPHEGEFMRLLGTDDKDVLKDRVTAVRDFATENNVILVLKGERILIGAPDGRVIVNPTGNSGLGKAGNGDTLTGILIGFVAQAVQMKIDMVETVVAACYIAGMAGDVAEKKYGKRVMTASDVRECLVDVFESLGASA